MIFLYMLKDSWSSTCVPTWTWIGEMLDFFDAISLRQRDVDGSAFRFMLLKMPFRHFLEAIATNSLLWVCYFIFAFHDVLLKIIIIIFKKWKLMAMKRFMFGSKANFSVLNSLIIPFLLLFFSAHCWNLFKYENDVKFKKRVI